MKGMIKMKYNYKKQFKEKKESVEEIIDKPSFEETTQEEWVVTEELDGTHVRPSVDGEVIDTPVEKIISFNELKELSETEETNKPVEEIHPINAVVVGCTKLRVRKAPSADAEVYGTINEGTELTVDFNSEEAHEDFYKVYTNINEVLVEGYCMKKFIKLK